MKIKYILFLLTPALLLAGGGGNGETDIFPRAVNFILFASILYYVVAEPAKAFFKGRIAGIADSLESIQVKVKESASAKEDAQAKVEKAKLEAKTLIETAKKEAILISEKVIKDTNAELKNLEKSFNEKTDVERRKMTREVVNNVLDEMFENDALSLDKNELIQIVMEKVAWWKGLLQKSM